jgi:cytochrome c-type biogenesis protein CcmH/NrfG
LWLSYFGIRTVIARHAAEASKASQLELAVRMEPGTPEYWYLLGRYQGLNIEQPDASLARRSFRKAIELNPLATDAWLDLGSLEEMERNSAEARSAYLEAKSASPGCHGFSASRCDKEIRRSNPISAG